MKIKKKLKYLALILGCSFLFASPAARADDPWVRYYLQLIYGRVTEILNASNKVLYQVSLIPVYIKEVSEMAASWNKTKDDANIIANNQTDFGLLAANYNRFTVAQLQKTSQLTEEYLKSGSYSKRTPVLPINANELNYPIVYELPIKALTKDELQNFNQNKKAYAENYLKNSIGTTFVLKQPDPNWPESPEKTQYLAMYNTLAAVKSYNIFLLTGLGQQPENDAIAQRLLNQASDANWFTQLGSQSLGLVLRNILMYTSQSYIQISHLVKLQRQQLAAQAMTNTLLSIQVQQMTGEILVQKIVNPRPPGP